jgi:hypothetical protein
MDYRPMKQVPEWERAIREEWRLAEWRSYFAQETSEMVANDRVARLTEGEFHSLRSLFLSVRDMPNTRENRIVLGMIRNVMAGLMSVDEFDAQIDRLAVHYKRHRY